MDTEHCSSTFAVGAQRLVMQPDVESRCVRQYGESGVGSGEAGWYSPRSMPDRDELRDRIVSVSVELASELGEEGVTMRGIARRLGISATAIYQHFEGKAAIMQAVRLRGMQVVVGDILAAFTIDEPRDCLLEVSRRYVAFARRSPWLYAVLMQSGEPLSRAIEGEPATRLAQLREQIRVRAMDKFGPVLGQSTEQLTRFMARWWCGLHGLASLIIGGRLTADHPMVPVVDVDRFADEYIVALVDGIESDAAASQTAS
ncbi:MAG: TetR/AcrR family transcriptional regulator [Myxococcales bacterium FL481]|nr:MAG: TetR/AcrR family transcriptional regulator [Myxococcales bacterium FL481]